MDQLNCPIDLTTDLQVYFMERVQDVSDSSCRLWKGSINSSTGYGTLCIKGKNYYAHRVALWLSGSFGKREEQSLHSCDVRDCVNPDHLRWGSEKENHLDSVARNRVVYGEKVVQAKLTEEAVRKARIDRASGMLIREIARKHGVTRSTMSRALAGRTWVRVLAPGRERSCG